jgi:hypothetical protein
MLKYVYSYQSQCGLLKPPYSICRYHILSKAICESPMWQIQNRFMLQDEEIDHRQRAGNLSD